MAIANPSFTKKKIAITWVVIFDLPANNFQFCLYKDSSKNQVGQLVGFMQMD